MQVTRLDLSLTLLFDWLHQGSSGRLTVQVKVPMRVKSITIDHIRRWSHLSLIPWTVRSTLFPQHWSSQHWDSTSQLRDSRSGEHRLTLNVSTLYKPHQLRLTSALLCGFSLLTSGTYLIDTAENIQNFPVSEQHSHTPLQIITLRVLNNHGSEDYTCIYRLRVHGIPVWCECFQMNTLMSDGGLI